MKMGSGGRMIAGPAYLALMLEVAGPKSATEHLD